MPPVRVVAVILTAIGAGLAFPGCSDSASSNLAPVSGRVTLDGKPLAAALVVFEGSDGRSANGITDADGQYTAHFTSTVVGAPVGKCRVRIGTDRAGTAEPAARKLVERVPDRYNIASQEFVEVKRGKNRFDFDLTTP